MSDALGGTAKPGRARQRFRPDGGGGVKRAGRVLLWLGPWIAVAVLAWREQSLEAKLAEWVAATTEAVAATGRMPDVDPDEPLFQTPQMDYGNGRSVPGPPTAPEPPEDRPVS